MGKFAARRANRAKSIPLLVITLLAIPTVAQQPVATTPQPTLPFYDVVSIHPHNALDDNINFDISASNFTESNASLKQLISYAWGIREDLISGLPGWADSARFDVTAKVSDPDLSAIRKLTKQQRGAMLRPMLTDRFHVKAHTETKTLAVFNLVLTKGGPKFKPSPPPTIDPDNPTANKRPSGTWIRNQDLTATAITMDGFADTLANQLNRTVIDKTGLTGEYDLSLKWTPDPLLNNPDDNGAADHPPNLFTALQEQLGLKLDASKGPVETLVVDHAEQPTPN
jgi:uncharacterized protein (TIGR03435 family)